MHGLNYKSSIPRCMQAAWFIENQAAMDPSVAEISTDILEHNRRLRAQVVARDEARDEVLAARAVLRWKQDELRRAIRVIGYSLVGQMNGRRSSYAYALLFPNGYGGMAKSRGDRLLEAANQLAQRLRLTTDEVVQSVMNTNGALFEQALAEARAATIALDGAILKAEDARIALGLVKMDWIDAYYRVQRFFEARFARDRRRAEVYFLRFDRNGRTTVNDAPEPEPSSETEVGRPEDFAKR
ncbi:MAG: hypothetical protein H6682_09325 [Candidatus Eisenbacteria bacterium]|nr:hypothetical protein [Candidatus Eisenbacteria bacterium]